MLNTHPLPPIINNPKQPKHREFFVGILKLQTVLGTECMGVVMGKRQARKKDIRLKSFPETGPSLFQTGLQQEEKCSLQIRILCFLEMGEKGKTKQNNITWPNT